MLIDYNILARSIEWYEDAGFKRIEAPWTVSEEISNLTKPPHIINFQFKHNNKCLVGSGEQSFLYLETKGFLSPGKYQTITPCFRYEEFSTRHSKYFMKNELIQTIDVNLTNLIYVIDLAICFFEKELGVAVKKIKTDIGYDIEFNGIELGSYGIRNFPHFKYIYGTGCAEPRLSYALKTLQNM